MRRRGITLLEVVMAGALMAIVIGSMMSLIAFFAVRSEAVFGDSLVTTQVNALADILEHQAAMASEVTVTSNSGGSVLRLTMPESGTDTDADGHLDLYTPKVIGNTGSPHYGKGERVTYFFGDSAGSYTASAANALYLQRAWRSDSASPANADVDTRFSDSQRWQFVESITYAVNAANKTLTITIVASRESNRWRPARGASGPTVRRVSVTRVVQYRGLP